MSYIGKVYMVPTKGTVKVINYSFSLQHENKNIITTEPNRMACEVIRVVDIPEAPAETMFLLKRLRRGLKQPYLVLTKADLANLEEATGKYRTRLIENEVLDMIK